MRIFLLGDTHGNKGWTTYSIKRAAELGIDQVLQLGDFGFWEHDPNDRFMDVVAEACDEHSVSFDWIDGNHECHPLLRSRYGPTGDRRDDNTTANGYVIRWPWLTYRPRGSRWSWDGRSFLGLGGAYSIDKPVRQVGRSWWHEEMITNVEAERAMVGGPVDVLVSHDVVAEAQIAMGMHRNWKSHHLTDANRQQLQRVKDRVRPKLIVHGHYHVRYREALDDGTQVVGLSWDGAGTDSWAVLDTETMIVSDVDVT